MMRRPLKPFVTEYKGGRRGAPSLAETPSFDTERVAPKPVEARTFAEPDADDSYEAAMRAADALFSAPSGRKPATAPGGDSDATTDSSDRGGRILRVIDEPPSPEYAAREAEFAPKRRGRKPGSKNKPKIPALTADNVVEFVPAPIEDDASNVAEAVAVPQAPVFSQQRVVALTSTAPSPRSEKRFPWLRDRLKPGENWKRRRLPKVCW